jgi:hypothetical protein
MSMSFFDHGQVSKPREEVKIEQLEIFPYPDRFRVFIHIRVTPFLERPNLILTARDEDDRVVSELSIIETMHFDMEFTMHIRNVTDPQGLYTLTATLYFQSKSPPQDEIVEAFEIPAESEAEQEE